MAMPTWQKEYDNAYDMSYINSDQYDPAQDFYINYYSDYSYQPIMKDPYTGQTFKCRDAPIQCYDLARIHKKLANPTKTTSTVFASVAVTTTSTFQWTSSRRPSIEIEWVSFRINLILLYNLKTYF